MNKERIYEDPAFLIDVPFDLENEIDQKISHKKEKSHIMFCWHDWVKFRSPESRGGYSDSVRKSYYYKNKYIGYLLERKVPHDYVCSKCNKLKLKLDKILIKVGIDNKKNQEIKERRNEAKAFAQKYIGLSEKA